MKTQQKGNIARQQEAMKIWEPRRAEVVSLYVEGNQSQQQMAAHYGVSLRGFQKVLERLDIPPKSRGRAGAGNGRYKDGTQSTAYRNMVEKTHCNRCGETRWLVIHHIDGVHTNNTPDNLEVLCSPCHTSHHKQEWWNSRKAGQSS
jgi:predicted HTH domain antitoxin